MSLVIHNYHNVERHYPLGDRFQHLEKTVWCKKTTVINDVTLDWKSNFLEEDSLYVYLVKKLNC